MIHRLFDSYVSCIVRAVLAPISDTVIVRMCAQGHGKASNATRAVLKKDDVLSSSNCVVRIMTNRKGGGWQKH
jgi:hypothetical protein